MRKSQLWDYPDSRNHNTHTTTHNEKAREIKDDPSFWTSPTELKFLWRNEGAGQLSRCWTTTIPQYAVQSPSCAPGQREAEPLHAPSEGPCALDKWKNISISVIFENKGTKWKIPSPGETCYSAYYFCTRWGCHNFFCFEPKSKWRCQCNAYT